MMTSFATTIPSNPFAMPTEDPEATQDGTLTLDDMSRLTVERAILGMIAVHGYADPQAIRGRVVVDGGPVAASAFNRAVRDMKFRGQFRMDDFGWVTRIY